MPHYRTFSEHLLSDGGPKRILALDGGGLRSLLTLGMLRQIEAVLRERYNDSHLRLSDYFDLIAGTSTGALIAAALSVGMTVDEVEGHFIRLGGVMFKRGFWRRGFVRETFDTDDVNEALKDVFGNTNMSSSNFRTGLLVMTKRLDTGSPWPITNNPAAKYFSPRPGSTTIPNAEFPLWQVVRASLGGLSFFEPATVKFGEPNADKEQVRGIFVDGGVSPSNNPALQALMMATLDGYRLNWRVGVDQLLVVSIGAGKADPGQGYANIAEGTAAIHAALALRSMVDDCVDQVETVMQWLSVSQTARTIDREIGHAQPPLGGNPMMTYLRYNVLLHARWLADELGLQITEEALKALEAMDDRDQVEGLMRVGRLAGSKLVHSGHFERCFDVGI